MANARKKSIIDPTYYHATKARPPKQKSNPNSKYLTLGERTDVVSSDPVTTLGTAATMRRLSKGDDAKKVRKIQQIKNLRAKAKTTEGNRQTHLAQAGECFRHLYSHDRLTDVTIFIDDIQFSVHKAILMTHSEYFKEILTGSDANARAEIGITGLTSLALESVLEYMYTAEVFLSMEIIANIHTAAEHLKMNVLLDKCDILIENLNPHDGIIILHTSHKKDSEVCKVAFAVVVQNFTEVVNTPGLTELEPEVFLWIIACDDLVIDTEMDVFRAIMSWLRRKFSERSRYTNEALLLVRYCYMTPLELLISSEMMEDLQNDLQEILLESMWYATARLYKRVPIVTANLILPPRRPTRDSPHDDEEKKTKEIVQDVEPKEGEKAILVVGGVHEDMKKISMDNAGKAIYVYTPHDTTWRLAGKMPEARHLHTVVIMMDCLFVLGGSRPMDTFEKHPFPTATVGKWNLKTKEWSQCKDMRSRRIHHSSVTLKNKIYVLGGQTDRGSVLSSVEAYCPNLDCWEEMESLIVGRIGLAAAVFNGRIYVAGGYQDSCYNSSGVPVLSSFEMYDPESNNWIYVSDLLSPRCHCNMVVIARELYVFGGATRANREGGGEPIIRSLSSVDKYDNKTFKWQTLTSLKYPRHGARAAVIGSRAYIIGGVSTIDHGPVNKVECWDMKTGKTRGSTLGCPAQTGMGVVVCNTADVIDDQPDIDKLLEKRHTAVF